MKKMFKGKKNKISKENPAHDKLAAKVASFIIKVQTNFSNFMNKRLSGLPAKKLKTILFLFCLFWGGLSGYFIAHAVFGSKQPSIKVDHVKVLQHINQPDDPQVEGEVDEDTYQQIQEYKKYMDSIHQAIRPGLLDSMQVLEQIYLQNKKNEANEK
jgi:hypothetical protein